MNLSIDKPDVLDFEFVQSTDEEIAVLNSLGEEYKKYSEMSNQDRAFLNSLILRKKPRKILEIGVSKGASSIIILNAIKDEEDSHLYSLDYNTEHYRIKGKKTGFYVDNFPELKKNWTLKTGGLSLNYLDEIGGDIDFCFIDTVHLNPGEILDVLQVLPYLTKDATIVFHDTNLHLKSTSLASGSVWCFTNNLLMSALKGKKMIPSDNPYPNFKGMCSNIGAVEVNEQTFKNVYELFNLLTIKWSYMPSKEDLAQLTEFFARFYNEYYLRYFKDIVKSHIEYRELNKKISFLEQIFSVKNQYKHKVVRILGIKVKFKNSKKMKEYAE